MCVCGQNAEIYSHSHTRTTPVWSRASPAAPRDSTKGLLYPLYEPCVSQESLSSAREGPQIAFAWHGCLFALWSSRTPSKGLAWAFWRAWHIVFEKLKRAGGCEKEKKESECLDRWTDRPDRQIESQPVCKSVLSALIWKRLFKVFYAILFLSCLYTSQLSCQPCS